MGYDGSGRFNVFTPGNPRVAGTTIAVAAINSTNTDFANGLSNAVTRDGQSPATANLPMGGFRHTGVSNAVARTDYAAAGQIGDGTFIYAGTAGGTADVLTALVTPAITAYVAGQAFELIAASNNATATPTIAFNGLAAKTITKQGSDPLSPGDIQAGAIIRLVYDGARFQLSSGQPGSLVLLQAPTVVSGSPLTVDFTTGFDASFDQLLITVTGFLPNTAGASLLGRISLDGVTYRNTAADYVHVRSYMDTSTVITSTGSAGDTQMTLAGAIVNTAGTGVDGQVWIANMSSSTVKKNIRADFTYFSGGVLAKQASSGCFVGTNGALLGFRFFLSAGNFSAGTFAIYGLRKA